MILYLFHLIFKILFFFQVLYILTLKIIIDMHPVWSELICLLFMRNWKVFGQQSKNDLKPVIIITARLPNLGWPAAILFISCAYKMTYWISFLHAEVEHVSIFYFPIKPLKMLSAKCQNIARVVIYTVVDSVMLSAYSFEFHGDIYVCQPLQTPVLWSEVANYQPGGLYASSNWQCYSSPPCLSRLTLYM